jgi:hypothetical protein
MEQLERLPITPGSMVKRKMAKVGTFHYGIASDQKGDNGEQLIYQFGGPIEKPPEKAGVWAKIGDRWLSTQENSYTTDAVSSVRLSTFADGKNVEVVKIAENPQEAVTRARTLLGQTGYNPLTRNCEHYAQWACNGDWKSEQVAGVASAAKVGVFALLGAAGVVFILYDRIRTR